MFFSLAKDIGRISDAMDKIGSKLDFICAAQQAGVTRSVEINVEDTLQCESSTSDSDHSSTSSTSSSSKDNTHKGDFNTNEAVTDAESAKKSLLKRRRVEKVTEDDVPPLVSPPASALSVAATDSVEQLPPAEAHAEDKAQDLKTPSVVNIEQSSDVSSKEIDRVVDIEDSLGDTQSENAADGEGAPATAEPAIHISAPEDSVQMLGSQGTPAPAFPEGTLSEQRSIKRSEKSASRGGSPVALGRSSPVMSSPTSSGAPSDDMILDHSVGAPSRETGEIESVASPDTNVESPHILDDSSVKTDA